MNRVPQCQYGNIPLAKCTKAEKSVFQYYIMYFVNKEYGIRIRLSKTALSKIENFHQRILKRFFLSTYTLNGNLNIIYTRKYPPRRYIIGLLAHIKSECKKMRHEKVIDEKSTFFVISSSNLAKIIFTKFHENRKKIMDFLLMA